MACCTICNYYFQPESQRETNEAISCPVCRIRTTTAVRSSVLRGRRIEYAYMDSD